MLIFLTPQREERTMCILGSPVFMTCNECGHSLAHVVGKVNGGSLLSCCECGRSQISENVMIPDQDDEWRSYRGFPQKKYFNPYT